MQAYDIVYDDIYEMNKFKIKLEKSSVENIRILNIEIKKYIYSNKILKKEFFKRVQQFENLQKEHEFIKSAQLFKEKFNSCFDIPPHPIYKPSIHNYPIGRPITLKQDIPAKFYIYIDEIDKLLVRYDSLDMPPDYETKKTQLMQWGNEMREFEIQVITEESKGLFNFYNSIVNKFTKNKKPSQEIGVFGEDYFTEENRKRRNKEIDDKKLLQNILDFWFINIEHTCFGKVTQGEYLVYYVAINNVISILLKFIHSKFNKKTSLKDNSRKKLNYFEDSHIFKIGSQEIMLEPEEVNFLYTICEEPSKIKRPISQKYRTYRTYINDKVRQQFNFNFDIIANRKYIINEKYFIY